MELVEKRTILLTDICARLSYNPMFHVENFEQPVRLIRVEVDEIDGVLLDFDYKNKNSLPLQVYLSEAIPYLRPLSTMTEEEYKEYEELILNEKDEKIKFCNSMRFYNSKHFDYRGLIDMGLALPAPEGMYNN